MFGIDDIGNIEIKWFDDKISAPYLIDKAWTFFSWIQDFEKKFKIFISEINSFTPREYVLQNFTFKKSTLDLLNIIKEYEQN